MAPPTYKILEFLKRRPGMSMDEFRDHYENVHRVLAEKYSAGLKRYLRRYLEPADGEEELPFDAVTELWFDDRPTFETVLGFLSRQALPAEIIEDELRFLDRPRCRTATVVEYESDMAEVARRHG